jgi:lipopolysaccharide transport system ATP-binding protein
VRDVLPELTAGILIRDRLGNDVFGTNTFHLGTSRASVPAGTMLTVEFVFPSLELGVGSYSLTAALHAKDTHVAENFDWWDRALVMQIVPGDRPLSIGVAALSVAASWVDAAPSPDPSTPRRQTVKG